LNSLATVLVAHEAAITLAIVLLGLGCFAILELMRANPARGRYVGITGLWVGFGAIIGIFSVPMNALFSGWEGLIIFVAPPVASLLAACEWGWLSIPLPIVTAFIFAVYFGNRARNGYAALGSLFLGLCLLLISIVGTTVGAVIRGLAKPKKATGP
jgi:hypothetical protein